MARQDYLCDDDGDLLWENGDLVVGDSDEQHIADICDLNPGDDKEFPLFGPGLIKYVKSTGKKPEIVRVIKEALKLDGYNKKVYFDDNGELVITEHG